MRVLVAEDEPRVAEAVARGLRREGAAVDVALDGRSALAKARAFDYDVLVLDRDLPELHGDVVCEAVHREQPETRILMLTAYGEIDDLVHGLAIGADDYLAKPFAFDELVARVRALGRRAQTSRPAAGCGSAIATSISPSTSSTCCMCCSRTPASSSAGMRC